MFMLFLLRPPANWRYRDVTMHALFVKKHEHTILTFPFDQVPAKQACCQDLTSGTESSLVGHYTQLTTHILIKPTYKSHLVGKQTNFLSSLVTHWLLVIGDTVQILVGEKIFSPLVVEYDLTIANYLGINSCLCKVINSLINLPCLAFNKIEWSNSWTWKQIEQKTCKFMLTKWLTLTTKMESNKKGSSQSSTLNSLCMSPVSPVFHAVVVVSIGLKI